MLSMKYYVGDGERKVDNLNNSNGLDEVSKFSKEIENINNDNEQDKKSKKNIFYYFPYLLVLTILLFFCVFGITYSVYKGDLDDSEINTGQILFTYSDVDKVGNGIYLKNAVNIPDIIGKMMVGKNEYFDFFVTATTTKSDILYYILVDKDESSTLQNDNVRVYLTQLMGSHETEIVLKNFSDLETKEINDKTYYVLYEKRLSYPLKNYTDAYRLRMWVKENANDYENKNFSVKIDVYAEQVKDSD